jgi:uncharacterized membrane protein
MVQLILAAFFFFAIHGLVSATGLRRLLVARLGENAYRGLFSLASAGGLVWLVLAYGHGDAGYVSLWAELPGIRWLSIVLMLPLLVMGVAGLTMKSPTAVAQEGALAEAEAAQGILRVTRHPFLCAVAGWGVLHLLANGDLASVVLFGSLVALAINGMASIDRKRAAAAPTDWARFAARTSRLPFAAILQGRNQLRISEIGWLRIVAGVAAWLALLHFHASIFGAAVWPQ